MYTQRRDTYDCGLACVSMVLKLLRLPAPSLSELVALAPGRNIWTIDLLLLLSSLGAPRLVFYTALAGVDPAHAALPYYERALSAEGERARLARAFAAARAQGIAVEERRLPLEHMLARLGCGSHAFLVLVDVALMRCEACGPQHSPAELAAFGDDVSTYKGHYVLLLAYDAAAALVTYADPSPRASAARCTVSLPCLEAARLARGTDVDTIEIPRPD
jgi:hypothetical protein